MRYKKNYLDSCEFVFIRVDSCSSFRSVNLRSSAFICGSSDRFPRVSKSGPDLRNTRSRPEITARPALGPIRKSDGSEPKCEFAAPPRPPESWRCCARCGGSRILGAGPATRKEHADGHMRQGNDRPPRITSA